MLKPIGNRVLLKVFPYQNSPGLVMSDRDSKPYKGEILEIGDGNPKFSIGDTVYFRYYMGFIIPDSEAELMILDYDNILATDYPEKGESNT